MAGAGCAGIDAGAPPCAGRTASRALARGPMRPASLVAPPGPERRPRSEWSRALDADRREARVAGRAGGFTACSAGSPRAAHSQEPPVLLTRLCWAPPPCFSPPPPSLALLLRDSPPPFFFLLRSEIRRLTLDLGEKKKGSRSRKKELRVKEGRSA